ncbi:family 43 glycosylhydrolase [Paenibacillus antarcticus]|uniref:Alpha-N-arabinofuranosidase n=1 Tax=Paenibacillus antarcticus TaxID=253703 RepID=A0A168QX53_9BACL|nr:family 43 glycosylhydrolase [Paenibacillus antarcticus]OAB48317.1 alpha-N-arabinofuranosidase [Paenibacillus antarcticus]
MFPKEKINNPVLPQRADPWVYKHTDGYYYFSASVPEYDRIEIRRSRVLNELGKAEPLTIWRKHESGLMSANIWAPEIHYSAGKWYLYYAAAHTSDTIEGIFDHRMFVLENEADNPLEGAWIEKGQIHTDWESFSLDATRFDHKGISYLVWAQKDPEIEGNSNLYIAELDNPWSIKGPQIMISQPELDWEMIGFKVNEGAAVVKHDGTIYISYSASATDHNYCMGLLHASVDSDLLNPVSWTKSSVPVFQSNATTEQYGPGHNSFTRSSDDTEDIIVYHARNYTEIDGDPLYDPNRHTRAQVFTWNLNGTPNFGFPVPDDQG